MQNKTVKMVLNDFYTVWRLLDFAMIQLNHSIHTTVKEVSQEVEEVKKVLKVQEKLKELESFEKVKKSIRQVLT